jgi:transcriptional regulator with GAF, ATPase, and Fis domain
MALVADASALLETLPGIELFGIEGRTATGVRGRGASSSLFRDEVSDLSLSAQVKLLRAIGDLTVQRVGGHAIHHVDIRIIGE